MSTDEHWVLEGAKLAGAQQDRTLEEAIAYLEAGGVDIHQPGQRVTKKKPSRVGRGGLSPSKESSGAIHYIVCAPRGDPTYERLRAHVFYHWSPGLDNQSIAEKVSHFPPQPHASRHHARYPWAPG